MRFFYTIILLGVIWGIVILLMLRFFNKRWWKIRWIRWSAIALPLFAIISACLWFYGRKFTISLFTETGGPLTAAFLVIMTGMIIVLPLTGFLGLADRLYARLRRKKETAPDSDLHDPERRTVLQGVAAAFPLLAIGAGTGGVSASYTDTKVYLLPMEFDNLPLELEGLRILHLSDSHLGIYKFLHDWEAIFPEAAKLKPDIVLMSGDISDDLSILPEALKIAESFNPRLGTFASLGNHEYYRGITRVRQIFDRSTIPLLIDEGITVSANGATIYIGGADDPRYLNRDTSEFLKNTVDTTMRLTGSDSFKILMSHRPEGFDRARELGVDLTLAGHTHGGQVGIGGRSVFSAMTDRYLWGLYGNSKSRLYVSSGIGHWFPFRLGCPTEAPVIELVRTGMTGGIRI